MPSIPLTALEETKVLKTLGLHKTDDLFSAIPPNIREKASIKLDMGEYDDGTGRGLTEHELRLFFQKLAAKNATAPEYQHFLGGGIYDNSIPAIVNQLVLRGEFLTCYTPYQPEISQGTLKAIFEFQTYICRLTEMPVANASMYDGASATAEAILMAQRVFPKNKNSIFVAANLNPDYRAVSETFLKNHTPLPKYIPWTKNGTLDLLYLKNQLAIETPCCVVVGSPNYFGGVEAIDEIKNLLPKDCLLVVAVSDPCSLSLFEAPGKMGADIVVGEAHQFGTPMLFGGPHVGFFATRKEFLRQMPGRLAGETTDIRGKTAYALTLSTREQHIRREKATSNICTNQGLIALRTTIYLSFLGKNGFLKMGELCYSYFEYLAEGLEKVGIHKQYPNALHFREGVFKIPHLEKRFQKALNHKIVPGIRLSKHFKNDPEFSDSLLICAHTKHTKKDIDQLIEVLSHD